MKALLVVLLSFSTIMVSCDKGETATELRERAEQKIIGKWMVEKYERKEYDPIPNLKSTEQHPGTAEDYYHFLNPNKVEIGSAPNSKIIVEYEVINPYQVWIHDKAWRITELTASKLTLLEDRNDVVNNKRFVTTIYLKR